MTSNTRSFLSAYVLLAIATKLYKFDLSDYISKSYFREMGYVLVDEGGEVERDSVVVLQEVGVGGA